MPDLPENESVYDEQIHPLMAKVIALCKEHGIGLAAQFQVRDEDEEPIAVTTVLTGKTYRSTPEFTALGEKLYRQTRPPTLRLTTRNAEGQITKVEDILG